MDGAYRDYGTSLDGFYVTRLSEGSHTIEARLANNDHSELTSAGSEDATQITINAGAQGINMDSPTNRSTVDSSAILLQLSTINYTLSPDKIGGAAVDGEGHYHVYVDGSYYNAGAESAFWIQGLEGGDHLIEVRQTANDHTEVGGLDWAYVTIPADRPGIEITSPPNGEIVGSSFTVTVNIENFTLDGDHVGGTPMDGMGHWHLFLDGSYYGYSATSTLSVSGVSSGPHLLRAELFNNDHSELDDRVVYEIAISVN